MLVRGRGVKEQIVVAPVLTSAMIPPMVQEWLANGQGIADWTDLEPDWFCLKVSKTTVEAGIRITIMYCRLLL